MSSNGEAKPEPTNGAKDAQGDILFKEAIPQTTESAGASRRKGSSSNIPQDESGWIHIRAVITSAEAATVIGKGGENVSVIRKMSGAKCTVSDFQKGAVERILTVSGVVDAVAKVGLYLILHFVNP